MGADDWDHLVSRGWQRNFGDDQERVASIEARTGVITGSARPIKNNFAEQGFMTYTEPGGAWTRDADTAFRKIERRVFERVREVRRDVCDEDHRNAVIEMCSIHLVRSNDFRDAQLRLLDDLQLSAMSDDYPTRQEAHKRFLARHGVPPPPGLVDYLIEMWMNVQRSGLVFFDSVEDRIGKIDAQLRWWHLQVVEVDPSRPASRARRTAWASLRRSADAMTAGFVAAARSVRVVSAHRWRAACACEVLIARHCRQTTHPPTRMKRALHCAPN
jgi:hypothetical protein